MKHCKLDTTGIVELKLPEYKNINGGGWIADLVEKLLCGCYGTAHAEAYTRVMARRSSI
jgi:hypothetical protein